MDKYLKMADVFPVEIRTDDESGSLICDEDGVILESFSGDKVADYTLHAISSHDELVAEVDLLRDMVIRMQTYLDMAGEYPEKESDNPVRKWLFDAIDCTK